MEALLGTSAGHLATYWTAAKAHLPGHSSEPPALVDFVERIRRKVGEALDEADCDTEAAVASMRSLYRESKTVGVDDCVERTIEATTS